MLQAVNQPLAFFRRCLKILRMNPARPRAAVRPLLHGARVDCPAQWRTISWSEQTLDGWRATFAVRFAPAPAPLSCECAPARWCGRAGVSVGLVLGGGGARGSAHVGVIRKLEEDGESIQATRCAATVTVMRLCVCVCGVNFGFVKACRLTWSVGRPLARWCRRCTPRRRSRQPLSLRESAPPPYCFFSA